MKICDVIRNKELYHLVDNKTVRFDEKSIVNEKCKSCDEIMSFSYRKEKVVDNECYYLDSDNEDRSIIVLRGICPNCEERHYAVFVLTDGGYESVGFYPEIFSAFDLDSKYSSVLTPEQLSNLGMAFKANSLGLGIASFVYLRRVLESLVKKVLDDNQASCKHLNSFKDKLKEAEKYVSLFPDRFGAVKGRLYNFISEGVHSWSEEECLELYSLAEYVVISVLDYYKKQKEETEKTEELQRRIGEFNNSKRKEND